MGLMYVFPTGPEDSNHYQAFEDKTVLKTYGLPYIFWFYALVILIIYSFLVLSIINPIIKLLEIGSVFDITLGIVFIAFLVLMPIIFLGFYFYEKQIITNFKEITLIHKVFFIPFYSKKITLSDHEIIVRHFIDSPNMARINDDKTMRAFYNQGYFELIAKTDSKTQLIDRSSRKADLEKIKKIILNIQ